MLFLLLPILNPFNSIYPRQLLFHSSPRQKFQIKIGFPHCDQILHNCAPKSSVFHLCPLFPPATFWWLPAMSNPRPGFASDVRIKKCSYKVERKKERQKSKKLTHVQWQDYCAAAGPSNPTLLLSCVSYCRLFSFSTGGEVWFCEVSNSISTRASW